MADLKISQLPETIAPLGIDIIPIVNQGNNKRVSVNNILALGYQGADVRALTGKYEDLFTTVINTSGEWDKAYDIGTAYSLVSSTFLTSETDNQTLFYTESSQDLTIRDGNTVSLSALNYLGTDIKELTARYTDVSTVVESNSGNWNEAYNISTEYQNASGTYALDSFVNSHFLNLTGGTITGDLTILQNLFVNGTAVYINASDLVVSDPIIYIGEDNTADTLDLGIMVSWTDPIEGYMHGGLVRRADNKIWTLFKGITAEPLSSVNIEWDQVGVEIDTLSANIAGSLIGDTVVFGSLSATGLILGSNLSITGGVSAGNLKIDDWNSAYEATTVYRNTSASYASINFVDSKFLPLSGGEIGGNLDVKTSLLSAGLDLHDIFLTAETDSQTLSFDEGTLDLGISNGNTLNLSSINTTFASNSSKYEEIYSNVMMNSSAYLSAVDLSFLSVSGNWDEAYNISTAYSLASSTFLTSETDSQTLSFDEGTKDLSISNGNTISLSALVDGTSVDTGVRILTANWQDTFTNVQSNSANWQTAYNQGSVYSSNSASYVTNTTLNTVSSQLVLNSDFSDYKTNVSGITATLLPTTVYQSASGNWQSTYTNYTSNSATFVKTVATTTPGASAVSTIVAVSALPVTPDPNTLYIVI